MTAPGAGLRIFFAGASGAIGARVVPMLIAAGHSVGAMTRSAEKVEWLASLGAEPIVCDVFDRAALIRAVDGFAPDLVLHELTDLPDDIVDLPADSLPNARIRTEGTRNLIDAIQGTATRIIAQSVAWTMRPGFEADAVAALETAVLEVNGIVLRYGFLYGPGTYYQRAFPPAPRVHIDMAAARTLEALNAATGIVTITEN